MTAPQKLRFAHALAELGVDVIEAGFPGQFRTPTATPCAPIAREVRGASIATLARCHAGDIEACARALEGAQQPRIHVFISTSPLHREHKLGLSREQVLERAVMGVELARRYVDDVEFSAEDALRTEPDFLAQVCSAALCRRRPHAQHPRYRRLHHARPRSARCSNTCAPHVPGAEHGGLQRALPQRPGPGRRQLAWPRSRAARARSNARSTASASAPATARWKSW